MLKNVLLILVTASLLLSGGAEVLYAQNAASRTGWLPAAPGVVYVQFKAKRVIDLTSITQMATGNAAVDALLAEIGVTGIERFAKTETFNLIDRRNGIDRMYIIHFSGEGVTSFEAADRLLALTEVESASPRFYFQSTYIPNDPQQNSQYALTKMNVRGAWDKTKGDPNVIIGISDDGVNYNHQDLIDNMYINPGEDGNDAQGNSKRSNNRDDDGDGYRDNWRGWDFIGTGDAGDESSWAPDNDPLPWSASNSHGTPVAGCASAKTDNNLGVAGVGFNCRFVPIKISDVAGELAAGYESIFYATVKRYRVLNCSWGGQLPSQYVPFVQALVNNATQNGTLIVAASGNDGKDIDVMPFYPASSKGVLAVGACDGDDKVIGFSNYGSAVDVFAPGGGLGSVSYPNDDAYTGNFGGTSGAAPLVAGAAGLIFSYKPDWTPGFVNRVLVDKCDLLASPTDRTNYWGRVNVGNALSPQGLYPGLIQTKLTVDGEENIELMYVNKEYTLAVSLKNVVGHGSNLFATLLPYEGYTITLAQHNLGTMAVNETKTATFKFKRISDFSTDLLNMPIALRDNDKYRDTIWVSLPVVGDEEWIEGSVKQEDGIDGIEFGTSYPNPTKEHVTIPFTLSRTEDVTFTVTDVLGRTRLETGSLVYGAGRHTVMLDTREFEGGLYYYTATLKTSGKRFVGQFIIAE